jgi:hypothetical protein
MREKVEQEAIGSDPLLLLLKYRYFIRDMCVHLTNEGSQKKGKGWGVYMCVGRYWLAAAGTMHTIVRLYIDYRN